jgi:cytochrome c peroxidase
LKLGRDTEMREAGNNVRLFLSCVASCAIGSTMMKRLFRVCCAAMLALLGRLETGQAETPPPAPLPLAALKHIFKRPTTPPHPVDNVPTPDTIALGKRLFFETRLSADNTMACATCHDPKRDFTDGRKVARGISKQDRPRNTPTLWNLAWAKTFYWDGRAPTLEAQARVPIEHPDEMGLALDAAAQRLASDAGYVRAFRDAFPEQPQPTPDTIVTAIAAYERTLVSPIARFDRWIEGDVAALNEREVAGFRLFTGKARCLACHGGWRFTDDRFHDVGLASLDLGRAALPGVTAEPHSFKTPTLRGLLRTAPYMHDGSKPSLDAVLRHYAGEMVQRPSLAPELKRGIVLTAQERGNLVRFLGTLSSDRIQRSAAR